MISQSSFNTNSIPERSLLAKAARRVGLFLHKGIAARLAVACVAVLGLQAAMAQQNYNLTLKTFTGDTSQLGTQTNLANAGLDVANQSSGNRAVQCDANGTHFGATSTPSWWAARNYLRTLQSYYTTNYTAYITIDRRNSSSSIGFGMGGGEQGSNGESDIGTSTNSAILFFAGNGSGNGEIRVVINGAKTTASSGVSLGANSGKNIMRVKMTYDAINQTIQFALDHSYNGIVFSADWTSALFNVADVNGLGLNLLNEWSSGDASKIYFGGDGDGSTTTGIGTIYTDLQVTTGVQTAVPVTFGATTPVGGATSVWMKPALSASISDGSVNTVVDASVKLYQDGALVASGGVRLGTNVVIAYTNSTPLAAGSTHSSMVTCTNSAGQSLTNLWGWTVSDYLTIPAGYALASPASTPGFGVSVFCTDASGPGPKATPGILAAEQQIAGGIVDAAGMPYPNLASPSSGSDTNVNWSLNGAVDLAGNFTGNTAPAGLYADREFLGVGPSSPNFVFDNFTKEISTYLRLTTGYYRMLVNSDDGFKLSIAPGLSNPAGTVLGGFLTGNHPPSDEVVDFVVTADGDYPFRLLFYQGSGNASLEWMIQNMTTGEKVLINDVNNPNAVLAFQTGSPRATLTKMLPANGYAPAPTTQGVEFKVTNGRTALTGSPVLKIDGQTVAPSIVSAGGVTTISWSPGAPHVYGSTHTAQLVWTENTTPSSTVWTNTTSFMVRQPVLDDLPYGTPWLEAADYDFGGGQMVTAANDMFSYNGDGYQQDLTPGDGSPYFPLLNVDYYNNPGNGTPGTYRGNHSLNTNLPGNGVGIELPGSSTLRPNSASVTVSRNIGWINPNIWGNYTRTIPNGIYTPMVSVAAPGVFGSAVSLVTAGVGTTNQTLIQVGKIQSATGTGGYQTYKLNQLANVDGGPAAVYVNGPGGSNTITLRWNFGLPGNPNFQLNAGWLALVPITNVPPVIAAVSPLNGATGISTNGQLVFSVQTYDRPVNPGSIALQFNGHAATPTVSGPNSAGILTVSYSFSGLAYSSTNIYSLSLSDTGAPAPVVTKTTSGTFVVMVPPPIPPSTPISYQQVGGQLILTWNQGVMLQATNVAGPWIPNPSATSPLTNSMNQPMMFYRVQIYP